MGQLTSAIDFSGFTVNGVILGHPATDGDLYVWDSGGLPDGTLEADGTVVPSVKPKKGEPKPDPIETWAGLRDLAEPDVSVVVAELAVEVRESVEGPAEVKAEPEPE